MATTVLSAHNCWRSTFQLSKCPSGAASETSEKSVGPLLPVEQNFNPTVAGSRHCRPFPKRAHDLQRRHCLTVPASRLNHFGGSVRHLGVTYGPGPNARKYTSADEPKNSEKACHNLRGRRKKKQQKSRECEGGRCG